MDSPGSITRCIRELEAGRRRDEAARILWDRYLAGLARHAVRMLGAMHAARDVVDEEDAFLAMMQRRLGLQCRPAAP